MSFAGQENRKIVLVILMRGNSKIVKGPMAAGVAGRIYRRLHAENYFAEQSPKAAEQPSNSVAAIPNAE